MSENYRPKSRVAQGELFERLVFIVYQSVVEEYNRLTGKRIQFIPFGGNHEGFDAVLYDCDTGTSVGIELKNLRDHYQVKPSWVERHIFGKEYRHCHPVHYIHVLTAGGNYSPQAKEMFRANNRIIARQFNGMTITSEEQLNDKKLIKRVRSNCFELLERVYGKVVYSLVSQQHSLFDKFTNSIHIIFFSWPPILYTVLPDPPPLKHIIQSKIKSALLASIKALLHVPLKEKKEEELKYQVNDTSLCQSYSQQDPPAPLFFSSFLHKK